MPSARTSIHADRDNCLIDVGFEETHSARSRSIHISRSWLPGWDPLTDSRSERHGARPAARWCVAVASRSMPWASGQKLDRQRIERTLPMHLMQLEHRHHAHGDVVFLVRPRS